MKMLWHEVPLVDTFTAIGSKPESFMGVSTEVFLVISIKKIAIAFCQEELGPKWEVADFKTN